MFKSSKCLWELLVMQLTDPKLHSRIAGCCVINFAPSSIFLMHWSFSHMKTASIRVISTEGKINAGVGEASLWTFPVLCV